LFFFYDGNKRTGRLMMNGVLLTNGLPVINLPASKRLEFNQLMLDFYLSNNEAPMRALPS
jgi:Fic family protein